MDTNYTFDVYEKIPKEERINWKLYVDAIYKADPNKKNFSAEVLSKLLGVKTQGGFRYLGKTESPKLVILFSTGEDIYWQDEIDNSLGIFLYYGDNKTPGNDLHKTNLHGNEILRYIFNLAASDTEEDRRKIPPVLVFSKAGGRNVKFLGLAVPGIKGKPNKDWLTAVWGCNEEGDRFQNYKAFFTILNTSTGSAYEQGFGINLAWLNDITEGHAYESDYAPKTWKNYIKKRRYSPLLSTVKNSKKSKEEQLPQDITKSKMLECLHDYFIEKDRGYSFEQFGADIIESLDDSVVNIDVTRPFKDGGFDAVGRYKIFKNVENSVFVEFYMQAKCYGRNTAVTVTDTARLISRIKNRQFGIMITTSYIAEQAYKEVIEDGHPIVFINGKNIIDYLFNECEIRSPESLTKWLDLNYGDSNLAFLETGKDVDYSMKLE
jgi:hypothetical protein